MTAPKVFVSYVHESAAHMNDVLAFATFLRSQGVDAVLDEWATEARHDWYAWAIREMASAAYVIVVASPTYRAVGDGTGPADTHRGVQSEADLLRDLVYGDRVRWMPKVLPVLLPGHDVDEIPLFLSPHTKSRFTVEAYTEAGAEKLLRTIHRRPAHVPPPLLARPDLPHRPDPAHVVWCAGMPADVAVGAGCVEVHLVPSEPMAETAPDLMKRVVAEMASRDESTAAVRTDPAGAIAWLEADGSGLAMYRTGQRSAWFIPVGEPAGSELVSTLADRITRLTASSSTARTSWLPAVGVGPARVVLPAVSVGELQPVEVATRLAAKVLAELEPPADHDAPDSSHATVSNVITGNVTGKVVQTGNVQGGIHL